MLLNKHNLNIAKLALKKNSQFTLNEIQVTPDETVVTDGHLLMSVSTLPTPAAEFPHTDAVDKWKPFNLASDKALKAASELPNKPAVPVLACASVIPIADKFAVVTTDLEVTRTWPAQENSNFPDYKRVIPNPDTMPFVIGIDARKLHALLSQFIALKNAESTEAPATVVFRFTNAHSAIRMDAHTDNQTMVGVLMPLRVDGTTNKIWEEGK